MVQFCCVYDCKKEWFPGCGLSFHRFPKNKSIADEWKKHVPGNITKTAVVCGMHFKDEDYVKTTTTKKLKYKAIPSVFPMAVSGGSSSRKRLAGSEPEERRAARSGRLGREGSSVSRLGAVPVADVLVCRICLATDRKVYSMNTYKTLSKAYGKLTGMSTDKQTLPPYLCCECTRRLLNYARFRATSLRAKSDLLEIVKDHGCVTLELIETIKGIQSPVSWSGSDEDLDVELAECESIYTGQAGPAHSPDPGPGAGTSEIKVENSFMIKQENFNANDTCDDMDTTGAPGVAFDDMKVEDDQDEGEGDAERSSNERCARVELEDIKTEGDISEEEASGVDGDGDGDAVWRAALAEQVADSVVKVEEPDRDVADEAIEYDTSYTCTVKDEVVHDVKAEDTRVVDQIHDSTDAHVEVRAGGDYSSDNGLSSAETRERPERSTPGAPAGEAPEDRSRVKVYTGRKQKSDSRLSAGNKLCCNKCPYQTYSEELLSKHLKAHAAADTWRCNACSFTCSETRRLLRHLRVHSDVQPFLCDPCKKLFVDDHTLKVHMRVHSEKRYSCSACSKAFREKSKLAVHTRVHTGVKPYSCDVCGRAFHIKSCLKNHLRTHSGEPQRTPARRGQ